MTQDIPEAGRVAVVVGAGGELGRATAVKLANRGMTVVAVDRNEAGLAALPDGIAREVADATDPQAVTPMIERIANRFGVPDALVNTLGAFATADALTTTPDQFHLMIDVNLAPALWLSQAVAPHMQSKGSGAIVDIASRPGLEPTAGMAGYGVAKAALST